MNDELNSLREQLRQKEAEIDLLKEITHVIGSEHNVQTVFDLVSSRALNLLQAETVTIPILSADQKSYTYRSAAGENADELLGADLPISVGICGWVLRHRTAWWRGALDLLEANERNQWEKEAGSLILVPLVGKRRFLGGIACINKARGGEFNKHDLDLLAMFAGQVSIAIENAMFFEELDTAKQAAVAYKKKLQKANQKLSATNQELQHLAVHDPLTGLPNRTLILDRLQQGILLAQRNRQKLSLIMIDLDRFKDINDSLGHAAGDQLLVSLGKRFQAALRTEDTIGRLGGDEFALVIPDANRDSALVVAGKLQAVLQTPLEIKDCALSVGASIGIAVYPDHGDNPVQLLKGADVAMYAAKRNRDEVAVYDPRLDTHTPDRLELLADLRAAVQDKLLDIALQPKVDLTSGTIIGAEALARWNHPKRGNVPPVEFIPLLEQTGLIKPFTLYIIEESARYCRQCLLLGFELSIAVNLSVHNLRDNKLPEQIDEILTRHNLDKRYLLLEITESAVMTDPEQSLALLTRLNAMGLQLSIDDFGTGYSSLSYLKRLPVSQLKIDRSFVQDMNNDKDDAMIVRSTIDLAHNLGLNTVAEGVETDETLTALADMNCDQAQGYLISRPLASEDFMQFLKNTEWKINTRPVPRSFIL